MERHAAREIEVDFRINKRVRNPRLIAPIVCSRIASFYLVELRSTESRSLQREIKSKTSSYVSLRFCLFFAGHLPAEFSFSSRFIASKFGQNSVQTPYWNKISRWIIRFQICKFLKTFIRRFFKTKEREDSRISPSKSRLKHAWTPIEIEDYAHDEKNANSIITPFFPLWHRYFQFSFSNRNRDPRSVTRREILFFFFFFSTKVENRKGINSE